MQSSGPYQMKGYLVEFGGMPGIRIKHLCIQRLLMTGQKLNRVSNRCIALPATTTSGNAYWFDASRRNMVHTGLNFTPTDLNEQVAEVASTSN